ncbi:MAG: XdhC family protein [Dietzia sp.]
MESVLEILSGWRAEGVPCALARVVATRGSSPLAPGTAMAVSATGAMAGGVSGGCVDGAVFTMCGQALDDGRPASAVFGPEGDDPLGAGPTCGGSLEVFVEPLPRGPHPVDRLARLVAQGRPAVAATVLDGPRAGEWAVRGLAGGGDGGGNGDGDDDEVPPWARGPMATAGAGSADGAVTVVPAEVAGRPGRVAVHRFDPPRLLVFGASAFAEALVPLGAALGYRVTVCDARPVFAAADRFPAAAEVVRCWPHRFLAATGVGPGDAICVLTHDPRFDVPLLVEALRSPAGYVGAMGSRRTHRDRVAELRALGMPEPHLARLRSPIGLDLGAGTAAETALSIAAELVAHRRGGTGSPLADLSRPIHPAPPCTARAGHPVILIEEVP